MNKELGSDFDVVTDFVHPVVQLDLGYGVQEGEEEPRLMKTAFKHQLDPIFISSTASKGHAGQ